MPGPPPKPADQRRRRNAPMANTVKLPAEGRRGAPPKWPLDGVTTAEKAAWKWLWSLPQAVAWERLGLVRTVGRYTRALVRAEQMGAQTFLLGEVRQLEDRLGLNPMSMLRLRWEISTDELAEVRDDRTQPARRLSAINPKAKRVAGT